MTTLPIYEFTFFTPEMVWDFGTNIPVMHNGEKIVIPKEKKFGVLIAEHEQEQFEETFMNGGNFRVEKIARYDMNPQPPGNRQHKTRLWRDFYVVSMTE